MQGAYRGGHAFVRHVRLAQVLQLLGDGKLVLGVLCCRGAGGCTTIGKVTLTLALLLLLAWLPAGMGVGGGVGYHAGGVGWGVGGGGGQAKRHTKGELTLRIM